MTPTVRLLSETRYGAFVRWLPRPEDGGDGGLEATCIITLSHPENSAPQTFYAKFCNDHSIQSRGLINEISGYILANRMGLAQPPKGCVAKIPLKKLSFTGLPRQHAWLKKAASTHRILPAFCTQDVSAPTPAHHYGKDALHAMHADLLKWADHHKAMAFDEIITNLDRHLNNLLRTGESTYAVIDHGRLVVGNGDWSVEHLNADGQYQNRLLNILYKGCQCEAANGMITAAEKALSMLTGMAEIRQWATLIAQNEADGRAFDNFLQARTIGAPQRIASRYCLC